MPDPCSTPTRHRTAIRVALAGLGLVQVLDGLYALFAPSSFYNDFPLGRGWVEALPAYSEHLVRDVGGLFLATGAILLAAAWTLQRRVVIVAAASFLLFSLPHAIYHFFNLGPYSTGDAIANVVGLAATVVLPIWVLFELRRQGRSPVAARRSAAAGDGNARIAGVPEDTHNPVIRISYRESRRRYGEVVDPLRVFAHNPKVLLGYAALEAASERSSLVDERLKHLAQVRAAMVCGCEWCLDFASAISEEAGVGEEDLRDLPTYSASDRFSELEKLVLDYATGISRSPVEVPDALFERLRAQFDEAELVELTNMIALENYRARFNWAFGIAGQGFAEGAFCVPPEARGQAVTATP
ncbi:MAG TPA: carboxymuconolactone decarboxylase family protein [Solirubrobacterales bacterium]